MQNIKVIAFDADDTLWVNEPYFQEIEKKFCEMLEDFLPHHSVAKELFKVEMDNLGLYGYGAKAFVLSMVETVLKVSNNTAPIGLIEKVIQYGKELINKEIELLGDVEEVLGKLQPKYRLVVATKGDLLDQERKLMKSGLEKYFHHIEIMSDKQVKDYQKLIKHLDIQPDEFMMIGNSLKSDVLPVLELGGVGVHVPYHTTWAHEVVDVKIENPNFYQISRLGEILNYFGD
ncbi:HAD family hydrolase [Lacihabitans soyangensis]|uniref:HAD family hydrolase n=1 Tax=Lacihabitans soyangensis TaxID=869394 RepID=A0AAE3GZY6_9BACT|nr:HAD family hydrolase [Lacihabitans soyangensis]MCP9762358.1 HAD family hydrolase [Lacihabitans soyangensis]